MITEQIQYYQTLSEIQKRAVHAMAYFTTKIDTHSIYTLISSSRGATKTFVNELIKECEAHEVLLRSEYFREYQIDVDFFIYVYPLITDEEKTAFAYIYRSRFYHGYNTSFVSTLKRYLQRITSGDGDTEEALLKFILKNSEYRYSLSAIFNYEHYEEIICEMGSKLLGVLICERIDSQIMLFPGIDTIITPLMSKFFDMEAYRATLSGDFEGGANMRLKVNDWEPFFRQATSLLVKEKQPEGAVAAFEKGLKKQRSVYKGVYLPIQPIWAFYYLSALLSLPPEQHRPVLEKIVQSVENKSVKFVDFAFLMVCRYMLYGPSGISGMQAQVAGLLFKPVCAPFDIFFLSLSLYFTQYKEYGRALSSLRTIVRETKENGYLIYALEMAYIISNWSGEDADRVFYEEIRQKAGFDAVLSKIGLKEDWEAAMDFLLDLLPRNDAEVIAEGNSRVAYFINPRFKSIQPALQKRSPKGGWSIGRNISLKSFTEGSVEGMTDQDRRIARYAFTLPYYGGRITFNDAVVLELIGHPYLFLEGTKNIPFELQQCTPEIRVVKTAKGYTLKSNIQLEGEGTVIWEKETNTRYRIYLLDEQQQRILKVVNSLSLVVPESGKTRLSEILSRFSSQFMVQSDLIDSRDDQIETVETDSRIRVQLLPFGETLKAELFAKPFGEHPPYCKPGIGGKVLIHNRNGDRVQVERDLEKERDTADRLLNEILMLENVNSDRDLLSFDNPLDSLSLLEILQQHLDEIVVEWPEGERYKMKGSIDFAQLNLLVKSRGDWFELEGEVKIDEETVLSLKELLEKSARGHKQFIELRPGEFVAMSSRLKKQLNHLQSFAQIGKKGVELNKFASVSMRDFFESQENLKADKAWRDFQKSVQQPLMKEIAVPEKLQAELRPYQEEGFRWMARLSEWGAGACLADDMGLGKTIQAIAILQHRAMQGPALVVAPVSVIPNWVSEIKKFAPDLCPHILLQSNREETFNLLGPGHVLVSSYGLLQSEETLFTSKEWNTLILDEAHNIKNYATKTSKAAMSLRSSFKLILTGTPIQNHLGEVWNLFNFINPGLLGSLSQFNEKFVKPDDDRGKRQLKKLIAPFILRRTKSAVLEELPPKTEIVHKIQLSDQETAFYEALRRQAIDKLEKEDNNTKLAQALAEITRLRQACCHPQLIEKNATIPSSKLNAFLSIVDELRENKHRALVFSQFVGHLTLVRQALDKQGISYLYLDGSTPLSQREASVRDFQAGKGDLFLISLKAGGLGLNLTEADFVIHLDPWWNPAIEDQASDRAHRIGQSRPVTVYRLVAENTIEEKITRLHHTKRNLADTLLEGSDKSAKLSAKELLNLIREEA